MGVPLEQLDTLAIADPHKAVVIDGCTAGPSDLGKNFTISGLVYDVTTGLIETVVPPKPDIAGQEDNGPWQLTLRA